MRCCDAVVKAVRAELGGRRPSLDAAEGLWLAMQILVGPQQAALVISYSTARVSDR